MPSTELLIQTDFRAKGPWLIDEKSLFRLDDIVDEFLGSKAPTSPGRSDTAQSEERRVTIFMRAGRKLQKTSLKESSLDPQFQNEIATGFSYEINISDCHGSLTIRPTENNEKELRVKVDAPANRREWPTGSNL